jgi:hypothetical protein
MQYIYYRIKKLCFKLVIKTSLYYDARSEKHQILRKRFAYCQMLVETKRPLDFQCPIRWKGHNRQMQRERNSRLRAQFVQCSGAISSAHINRIVHNYVQSLQNTNRYYSVQNGNVTFLYQTTVLLLLIWVAPSKIEGKISVTHTYELYT